jgi:hypothetical protein
MAAVTLSKVELATLKAALGLAQQSHRKNSSNLRDSTGDEGRLRINETNARKTDDEFVRIECLRDRFGIG